MNYAAKATSPNPGLHPTSTPWRLRRPSVLAGEAHVRRTSVVPSRARPEALTSTTAHAGLLSTLGLATPRGRPTRFGRVRATPARGSSHQTVGTVPPSITYLLPWM